MSTRRPGGRVVVVGSLNVDLVATVEALPGAGETVLGSNLRRLPGGKGANQAAAAAAAGASVRLVGRVGDDADGRAYVEGLAARGVDVTQVQAVGDAPTGTALITVDAAGENTIVVVAGANGRLTVGDLDAARLDDADVLLAQLEVPLDVVAEAVRRAAAAGVRVVLNIAPYADLPADLLDRCDPVVANEHEAAALTRPPRSLVVTRGAWGARWTRAASRDGSDPQILEVPAPPVDVVDTTGAGDAFAGTLAAALADGADDETALRSAVEAASDSVTRPGAQDWSLA